MAKKKRSDEPIVDVEEVYSKTETYIEDNKTSLIIIVAAIVILVGGYFVWTKMIIAPQAEEAQGYMWKAQQYFEQDSFKLAVEGDGLNFGFKYLAEEYSSTQPGNLALYYTGVSYLRMGDFNKALEYLTEFDSDDQMVGPMATGAIGDCYMELGNTNEALTHYMKAAEKQDNQFTTPIFLKKTGFAHEQLGNYIAAIEVYDRIKKDYPESDQARDIDKYIERARGLSSK